MENSDSEYFESADEDFESDYEEREKRSDSDKTAHLTVSHKIIEPELCKLKIDEKPEVKGVEGTTYVVSTVDNKKGLNKPQKITELGSSTLFDNPLDDPHKAQETDTEPCDHHQASKEELHIELTEGLTKPKTILDRRKIQEPDSSKLLTGNNQPNIVTPLTQAQTEEVEENLWEDDELDWGSEAAKEESQKNQQPSPESTNEDSGWDDFDADWESHGTASSKKTATNEKSFLNHKDNVSSDDDGWEPLEKPEEKTDSAWGGWTGWGVSSLLNTATQSVSSITNQLSTVLETGMGIPDPKEMARINKEAVNKESEHSSDTSPTSFGLGNFVSGVTKFVESTGTKVITGGLDTLEAIGKKTVEVLQEGDPGLKKKRAFLKLDSGKPNLSQILREAKEKAEEENKATIQENVEIRRIKNYEALFDDHQGLVHLEALEMLSKLCGIKLDKLNSSLSGEALKDMQETLEQVKELCELTEEEEEDKVDLVEAKETIMNAVKEINIPISYNKLFAVCEETDTWLKNINFQLIDDIELHQQAIDTLAQLTALAVEQFHKAGELLMVKDHRSTADEADSLVQITTVLRMLILSKAGRFTDKLNSIDNSNKDRISEHITNIFYEAANSATYIQDAFKLLIPVLQVGAV